MSKAVENLKALMVDAQRVARGAGPHPVYPGAIAAAAIALLNQNSAKADQHQANGLFCAHQFRVQLPGDPTLYRVIVAPADAPVFVGKVPADEHFSQPITEE